MIEGDLTGGREPSRFPVCGYLSQLRSELELYAMVMTVCGALKGLQERNEFLCGNLRNDLSV